MRLKLISCEIFYREMCAVVARSPNTVDVEFLPKGLHDIGKNLVSSMLEGGGFEVVDLGADVTPEKFVEAVRANNANLVCLSALLTVTMPSMKTTIEALKQAGVRERVKVMIGGAPVTQQYADEIGADAYGENATAAVTFARKLVAK